MLFNKKDDKNAAFEMTINRGGGKVLRMCRWLLDAVWWRKANEVAAVILMPSDPPSKGDVEFGNGCFRVIILGSKSEDEKTINGELFI